MVQLSSKMMTHHPVMTSLRIKILKIDKFGNFSCDIDYNNSTCVFRDVIYLIVTNMTPGAHKVSASRAAQASEARLYIYILTIKTRLMFVYTLEPLLSGQCGTGGCPDNRIVRISEVRIREVPVTQKST